MDQTDSITIQEKRKRGKHLIQEERGMIQVLHIALAIYHY